MASRVTPSGSSLTRASTRRFTRMRPVSLPGASGAWPAVTCCAVKAASANCELARMGAARALEVTLATLGFGFGRAGCLNAAPSPAFDCDPRRQTERGRRRRRRVARRWRIAFDLRLAENCLRVRGRPIPAPISGLRRAGRWAAERPLRTPSRTSRGSVARCRSLFAPVCRPESQLFPGTPREWRVPDSNRGHHDFQRAAVGGRKRPSAGPSGSAASRRAGTFAGFRAC